MANTGQISKIWAGAKEVGLDEQDLRDLVERVSGSRSISALSFRHAGDVIDALVQLGARPGAGATKPSGRRKAPGEVQMITPDQRTLIRRLRADLGGQWERDPYFEGACKRVIRSDRPRTAAQASRVIEMLKKRRTHDNNRRAAKGAAE